LALVESDARNFVADFSSLPFQERLESVLPFRSDRTLLRRALLEMERLGLWSKPHQPSLPEKLQASILESFRGKMLHSDLDIAPAMDLACRLVVCQHWHDKYQDLFRRGSFAVATEALSHLARMPETVVVSWCKGSAKFEELQRSPEALAVTWDNRKESLLPFHKEALEDLGRSLRLEQFNMDDAQMHNLIEVVVGMSYTTNKPHS
jgi:hypothetical protein